MIYASFQNERRKGMKSTFAMNTFKAEKNSACFSCADSSNGIISDTASAVSFVICGVVRLISLILISLVAVERTKRFEREPVI